MEGDSTSDLEDVNAINSRLANDNERLSETVATLKSQLKQTLEFQTQNEALQRENGRIQAELRSSKARVDDLQCRLNINLKMLEEAKSKDEKSKNAIKIDLPTGAEIIDQERKKFVKQVSKFNDEISSREEMLKQSRIENDEIQSQLNNVLKKAQEKFNSVFSDANSLISYLSSMPNNTTINETTKVPEAPPLFDERLLRKIEKLKDQLRNENKERIKAEKQVVDISKQLKDVQSIANKKINEVNEQIADVKHQNSMKLIEESHEIDNLKLENENLRNVNQKLSTRLEEAENELEKQKTSFSKTEMLLENNSLKKEIQHLSNILRDRDQSIYSLKSQMETAQSQNKTIDLQQQSNKKKIANLQKECSDIQVVKESLSCENRALILQKSGLEEQVRSLNAKISSFNTSIQQMSTANEQLRVEKNSSINAAAIIEETINNQKREIQDLAYQRDKLVQLVQRQNRAITSLETQFESLQSECKNVKKSFKITQLKLNEEMGKAPVLVEIPVTAWYHKDFPRELCQLINDFAKNDSLDPSAKLRNVLQTIVKYYNSELTEQKKNIEILQNREKAANDFLSKLGSHFNFDNLSIDSVASECGMLNEMHNRIQILKTEHSDTNNEKNRIQNQLSSLISKLDVNSVQDANEMVTQLYQRIEQLEKDLHAERSNFSKAKKLIKALDSQNASKLSELETNTTHFQTVIKEKDDQIKEATELLQKSEKSIAELQHQISQQKVIYEQEILKQKECQQKEVNNVSERSQAKQKELSSELNHKLNEVNSLKQKISGLEREVEQWKRSAGAIDDIKRQKEHQIQALIDQYEEAEKEYRSIANKEKEALKEQYEKCIVEIKQKNAELSCTHDETNSALQESNNRVNDLTQKLVSAGLQIDDLKSRVALIAEETERQIRITEMKAKSSLLSQEMQFQNQVEANRYEFYTEKRKIIGFVSQQFRQYFDAHMELDENCLKSVIRSVRQEIDRLVKQEASIRQILGISSKDQIEEAVSKTVLALFQRQC